MIPAFYKLTDPEIELMLKAPFLTCILIAGADGNVDRKEIRKAIELATKKQKKANAALAEYYRAVGEDFEDKFLIVFQTYPSNAAERSRMISDELARLNAVLPKLDKGFAIAFYESIREIAMGIATSSGGVLGMNKVGDEEARYIELKMINAPS